ncbi:MAG TPA: hypothetical protein VK165_11045 [Azonexus sp.]|nr:hypothetical protein [Azonexus sp.]
MSLYENQHIGQFLISLGYEIGRRNLNINCSANLLQQTPLDAPLADIHVGPDDRFVMIEFKKEGATDSEVQKDGIREHVIKKICNLPMGYARLTSLMHCSARSHWLAESTICNDQPDATFKAYLLLFKPLITNSHGSDWLKRYDSINDFVHGLFDECDDFIGVTRDEFQEYLDYLLKEADGITPSNTDWLILKANNGGLSWSTTTVTSYLSEKIKTPKTGRPKKVVP